MTTCGQSPAETVQLAIIKLPYIPKTPEDPPHQGAVHVALGGWSVSSTNFLVRFGHSYQPLFVGYDLIAIGKPIAASAPFAISSGNELADNSRLSRLGLVYAFVPLLRVRDGAPRMGHVAAPTSRSR